MDYPEGSLQEIWDYGYSVAELWGFAPRVSRRDCEIYEPHSLLWGILGIVEYQVDKGAGHRYLRQRIEAGDWIGIGYSEADEKRLRVIPQIKDAKFGRKKSVVGDGVTNYVNVRFVHQQFFAKAGPTPVLG